MEKVKMTVSLLKELYYRFNPKGHYFDRETLKFFGDTMSNYGVRSNTVRIKEYYSDNNIIECYELYRKKPVKCNMKDSCYFCINTFRPIQGEIIS